MRKRPPSHTRPIETLEARQLFSTATLRVASYNIEDDIDGYTAPRPGLAVVLEGIGADTIGSTARPVDVLALTETTSNGATVAPIVTALNAYYGSGTYAASTLQLTESGGDAADGNGPSALVYDTKTVQLLASVGLSGTLGSSTGVYRQVGRYELEAVGSTSPFYVYVDHYKSGTGTTNAKYRGEEAAVVRADEATLPTTARVIYAGDFNTNADGEALFTTLMGTGQGQAFDALDPTAASATSRRASAPTPSRPRRWNTGTITRWSRRTCSTTRPAWSWSAGPSRRSATTGRSQPAAASPRRPTPP